ncbi:MAG: phosphoglycolate phosphatase [Methanolinea sp.]|nr:phosphoglycolate phosphatase [Methanolinea sp.]
MITRDQSVPELRGLVTDVDGTLTDQSRRLNTGAIEAIRTLVDNGVQVVLASGNTACFMDALCRMIGTSGSFIGENGGVYRVSHTGKLVTMGDGSGSRKALADLTSFYRDKGITLDLFSFPYRFVDVAFARTVPVSEVRTVLKDYPVEVLNTGFAIHIQPPGITKGVAFSSLAREIGLDTRDFLAVGDAQNDIDMLSRAGVGAAVANAHQELRDGADWISDKKYGDGFIDALKKYFPNYFLDR